MPPITIGQGGTTNINLDGMRELILEERNELERIHRRAVKDLEDEERLRADFEHRRVRELNTLIREEEERVDKWRLRLKENIEKKEKDLEAWRVKQLSLPPIVQ